MPKLRGILVTDLWLREDSMANKTQKKRTINWELACSFTGLVHYRHHREQGDRQADMVLKKQLRMLHPESQASGGER